MRSTTPCVCGSHRFVHAFSAARDCNYVSIPHLQYKSEGYMPEVGLGYDSDGIDITVCLDCGRVQGQFPVTDMQLAHNRFPENLVEENWQARAWTPFYTTQGPVVFLRISRATAGQCASNIQSATKAFVSRALKSVWNKELRDQLTTAVICLLSADGSRTWFSFTYSPNAPGEGGVWVTIPEDQLCTETGMPALGELEKACELWPAPEPKLDSTGGVQ